MEFTRSGIPALLGNRDTTLGQIKELDVAGCKLAGVYGTKKDGHITSIGFYLEVQEEVSETFGTPLGDEFDEHIEGSLQEITGRTAWRIDKIGFTSDKDQFSIGGNGGSPNSCELSEGETITSVVVTWSTYLQTMTFKTSGGNSCEFGTNHGSN